jgi:hypothetical protein
MSVIRAEAMFESWNPEEANQRKCGKKSDDDSDATPKRCRLCVGITFTCLTHYTGGDCHPADRRGNQCGDRPGDGRSHGHLL